MFMQINFVTIAIAYLIMNLPIFKDIKVFLLFLMLIFFLTVIPTSYMFVDNLFLFFILFMFTINVQKKETIFFSLIRVVCPFFVVAALSVFDDLFFRRLLYLKVSLSMSLMLSNCLFYLVIYLISQGMNKKIIPLITHKRKEKKVAIILVVVYTLSQSVFMYLFFNDDKYQRTLSIFITLSFLLLLYLFAQSIFNSQKLIIEVEKQKIESKFMMEYAKEATNQQQEIRKFKHDYINILSSLEYFIQTNDMGSLSDYYKNNIQSTKGLLAEGTLNFRELENIQSEEIKSIMAVKLLLAKEKKIAINLEVPDYLPQSFLVNSLTLVRMLGIILDNSIEEASQMLEGSIDIGLFDLDTHYLFIVKNSIRENIPPLHLLEKEGYSTKDYSRGLGLSNLKRLSQKEDYLMLETQIEPTTFSQKITIKKVI